MSSFVISAPSSGSGKTTLTLGLLRALRNRGESVQPFKCGPDYIDPMFHRLACGTQSINLDIRLSSEAHVRDLFAQASGAAHRCSEGCMGLFDGSDRSQYSTAHVAHVLDVPVILVVNARSAAYSIAPLLHGFASFRPQEVRIAGVIFNNVGSQRHYQMLRQAAEDAQVECLGYLGRNPQLAIPSRHLGLTIQQGAEVESLISLAAEEAEKTINIERICEWQ